MKNIRKRHRTLQRLLLLQQASPFKFTRSVMTAIDKKYEAMEDFQLVDELSELDKNFSASGNRRNSYS